MAREKKITFRDFRNDMMLRQVAGEPNTAHWNAPLCVLDPLYHPPTEIDREILYDYSRGRRYQCGIVRVNL